MEKEKRFKKKMKKSLYLLSFLTMFLNYSFGQVPPCAFDEILEYNIYETPNFQFLMEQAEENIQEMLNGNPQALMNNTVYTIPVVFHIIHLGEPIGTGSNISEAQVLQALNDLNSDFRDFQMTGTDVQIEFCLAQRDPDGGSQYNGAGDNITGIQRVNGSGTGDYDFMGITSGVSGNEVDVKALSNWPNTDYLNIWIVFNISGGAVGYATFPVADDSVDGIVLQANVTGISDYSHIISHEAGHFLDLYHTFEGSSSFVNCPSIINCQTGGDMICDTRPHSYMNETNNWFPCDESQYFNCTAFPDTYNVTENHMNYTDNDCRNEFTADQVMRLRCALMTLRPTLMNSLGCQIGCPDVIVDFSPLLTTVDEGETVTFTNESSNATSYMWEVNDESFVSLDLTYTFMERGYYDVCLSASNDNCTNRKCIEVMVIGEDPCFGETTDCDLLLNGDFSKINFTPEANIYHNIFFGTSLNTVCDWINKEGSPDLVYNNEFLATTMFSQKPSGGSEGIRSELPIHFEANREYIIEFDYLYAAKNPWDWNLSLNVGLWHTGNIPDHIIANVSDGPVYVTGDPKYFWQFYDESLFKRRSICIKFEEDYLNGRLFFTNEGEGSDILWAYIKNIKITCKDLSCQPIPDFTYDVDCPKEFMGINTGDGDVYIWDFNCNGLTISGQNVTIDLPEGDCEVCLTAICGYEPPVTICKTVSIPDTSIDCPKVCQDLTVELQTCKQDTDSETTFIADFSISVPDGTTACQGVDIVSGSNQFDASTSVSIVDDPMDLSMDIVNISITIITPPGTDILNNSILGLINLCDIDGNVLCYNLICVATECTHCGGEITADAVCVDPNPFDDEYFYEGSFSFILPNDGGPYFECEPLSSEVGYEQVVDINGNNVSMDFTISTETQGAFNPSSLLCFHDDASNTQICYTLNIEIDPCEKPECIDWGNKVADAENCVVADGQVTYTMEMRDVWLFGLSYSDCGSGLMAYLDGSENVSLSDGNIISNGEFLNYSVSITMPCGFDTDQLYELIIVACDNVGDLVCFSFNIRFPDCDANCDDRDDDGDGNREESITGRSNSYNVSKTTFLLYPNPTYNDAVLSIDNPNSKRHTVHVLDQLGSRVLDRSFETNIRLDLSHLQSGLHFIKVTDQGGNDLGCEKLIILN